MKQFLKGESLEKFLKPPLEELRKVPLKRFLKFARIPGGVRKEVHALILKGIHGRFPKEILGKNLEEGTHKKMF